MYSAKGGQIMRLKYVPIYSQYKNNIFWILKTAISKNDMELTGTCGMSDKTLGFPDSANFCVNLVKSRGYSLWFFRLS